MGMFITIKLNRGCLYCGRKVWWQTKDLVIDGVYLVANLLQEYEVNERMDAGLGAYCDKCGKVSNLTIKKGKVLEKN